MSLGFLARTTSIDQLKAGLDVSAQRVRSIADRVARASAQAQGFSLPPTAQASAGPESDPVDIETEMVNLADEQLRYEATAKLLEKTYAGLRAAVSR